MQFNASAFDRLVIPAERKRLIEALVLSHRAGEPPPGASGAKDGHGTLSPPAAAPNVSAEATSVTAPASVGDIT